MDQVLITRSLPPLGVVCTSGCLSEPYVNVDDLVPGIQENITNF